MGRRRDDRKRGKQQREGGDRSRGRDRDKHKGRDRDRGPRKRRAWLGRSDVIETLSGAEEALGTQGVAERMGVTGDSVREVAKILRELVEAGDAIETRPGRYVVAGGAGGQYPVTLIREGEALAAVFPEDRVLPVHPRHTLGAQPGDEAIAMINSDEQAMLVRMVRRFGRQLVGSLDFRTSTTVFIPDNRREDTLPMLDRRKDLRDQITAGDRVIITIEADGEGEPAARLVRILDETTPEVADFELVRLMHDLPGPFADEVEKAAAASSAQAFQADGRRDLRDELIFTIDPETAKDFDDAISLERQRDGYLVGVHIADVSHFVEQDGIIDNEAIERGTSCYLVNRVIPMLPEVLSNGACSLVPHEERYSLSVFIELDKQLKVTSIQPCESIIRSRQRLTYEQAMAIINREEIEGDIPEQVVDQVRHCHRLAQDLRKRREQAGALNLFSIEHSFQLDAEGEPIEVSQDSGDESHQLIEEFMLLANRCIAKWLVDQGSSCVFRVHGEPDEERLEYFNDILDNYGIHDANVFDRGGLQQLLRRLQKEPPTARLVLNFLCLRSFQKAIYDVENIGHYALAFEFYAHFTSPIRRYPDLIVHRLVKKKLGLQRYAEAEDRIDHLDALAKQCSYLERRAEDAERDLDRIKAARYLKKRIGEVFTGVVTGVAPHGLFVQLIETGLDGLLPVRELGDDYYEYHHDQLALVGRGSGHVLGIGLELDVQVVAVDIGRGQVDLGLG